jgi:hypothetical protein
LRVALNCLEVWGVDALRRHIEEDQTGVVTRITVPRRGAKTLWVHPVFFFQEKPGDLYQVLPASLALKPNGDSFHDFDD